MQLPRGKNGRHAPLPSRLDLVFPGSYIAVLVVGVLSLLGHLLGPQLDSTAQTGFAPSSPVSAVASVTGVAETLVHVDAHGLDAEAHPDSGGHSHAYGTACGYLLPPSADDQLVTPPAAWVDAAPATPVPSFAGTAVCSAGGRDPPDLVRELQVIRV